MIESDTVQTMSPTSSPHPPMHMLPPPCTPPPASPPPEAPQSGLLLAPITADHSRSDFPARDLDFVSRPCPAWAPVQWGGEAEGARRGKARRGSPSQLAWITIIWLWWEWIEYLSLGVRDYVIHFHSMSESSTKYKEVNYWKSSLFSFVSCNILLTFKTFETHYIFKWHKVSSRLAVVHGC